MDKKCVDVFRFSNKTFFFKKKPLGSKGLDIGNILKSSSRVAAENQF